ncbi:hypothetical protein Golob_026026 [Gossypium lobatum]|uniref:Uncharacterized protein n=1 Tax=Gossypium lobatum TaxID=34289 RepID=A0A7J8LTU1_9ROSI|nr:hypothetical protein [Gossypium lobatum]
MRSVTVLVHLRKKKTITIVMEKPKPSLELKIEN